MTTIQNHIAARPSPTAVSGQEGKRTPVGVERHVRHRIAYYGIITGYHAWDCSCGHRIFTEHGPQSVPPPWTGRTSSVTRQLV